MENIMIQGTASNVGKSILVTALCRIFTQDDYSVAPFKSQNMSLNSYITADGKEMGRAQVVQAEACKKMPCCNMNPILLKPSSDKKSQIVLNGKVFGVMDAKAYYNIKPHFMSEIKKAYETLSKENDIVVLEGAGSPAEINLKENDIVNMGMASAVNSPVLLVGDIDKGGVFASLVGTIALLSEEERKMVKGLIINKFRGDVSLLKPGIEQIETMLKIPVLGVVPMLNINIEQEDSQTKTQFHKHQTYNVDIAVIELPYISNFTDANALSLEPMTKVRFVKSAEELGNPDIIIIPGTKNTMNALKMLKNTHLDEKIKEAYKNGSFIFGICGGYQIMGTSIFDKNKVESNQTFMEGLKLLTIKTIFSNQKATVLSKGTENFSNQEIEGYEIHMGTEEVNFSEMLPFIKKADGTFDGAMTQNKKAIGTYFHGVFDNGQFTRNYLNFVRKQKGKQQYEGAILNYKAYKEKQYDNLAASVRKHLDIEKIYQIMEEGI